MAQNETGAPAPVTEAQAQAGARIVTALFHAVEKLPQNLQALPVNAPAVLPAILEAIRSELRLPPAQQISADPTEPRPEFDPGAAIKCTGEILMFGASVIVPGGELVRIVREAGGIAKFAALFVRFATSRIGAAEIGEDALKIFEQLLGVDGIVQDCSAAFA